MRQSNKVLTLKTLTKSNVWNMQENDIFRVLEVAGRDAELRENLNHYYDIIRSAFEIEEVKDGNPQIIKKYEERDFKIGFHHSENDTEKVLAIKKRVIKRVTDLTYENIQYISATKLLEVIERNFGGGWNSLSLSIQDIINSGFDISTTTLPIDRLHKHGGMYEKKMDDGYEVLEIEKGKWVEAVFAKKKPKIEKSLSRTNDFDNFDSEGNIIETSNSNISEDEDTTDNAFEDEESYRTTYDETETDDDLSIEAAGVADDEGNF